MPYYEVFFKREKIPSISQEIIRNKINPPGQEEQKLIWHVSWCISQLTSVFSYSLCFSQVTNLCYRNVAQQHWRHQSRRVIDVGFYYQNWRHKLMQIQQEDAACEQRVSNSLEVFLNDMEHELSKTPKTTGWIHFSTTQRGSVGVGGAVSFPTRSRRLQMENKTARDPRVHQFSVRSCWLLKCKNWLLGFVGFAEAVFIIHRGARTKEQRLGYTIDYSISA